MVKKDTYKGYDVAQKEAEIYDPLSQGTHAADINVEEGYKSVTSQEVFDEGSEVNLSDGKEEGGEKSKGEGEEANQSDRSTSSSDGDMEDEITVLKDKLQQAEDKYVRLFAELENIRRRHTREVADMLLTANEGLIKSFLPVLDDLQRSSGAVDTDTKENFEAVKEGLRLINKNIRGVLLKHNLTVVKISKGDKFDVERHEAVTQFKGDKDMKGKVIDVLEDGYMLGDKVIRYAKVVVGS